MANANAPRGLVPVQHIDGSPYNGAFNIYNVPVGYATALYLGDPVAASGASDGIGTPVVQIATAAGSNYILGCVVGIVVGGDPVVAVTRDLPVYHPASTNQYILVADNPDLIFEMQEDSVGGSIAMATAGTKNVSLIAGSGSTVTGFSGWLLDSSTISTSALQMRLLRGVQRADNTMASSYAKWLCRINLHALTNTTGV